MRYLLPNKSQYKVNLHAHTTVSDGMLSPLEVKELYKSHGYSAVAFTDHDVLLRHNELTDGEFVALNGYEYKINEGHRAHAGDLYRSFHINLIARNPRIDTQVCFNANDITTNAVNYLHFVKYVGTPYVYEYSARGVNDLAAQARAVGFLVHYNHPVWCMNGMDILADIDAFDGVELINTNSHKVKGLPEDADTIYEQLLRAGKRPYPLACDDNHNQYTYNSDSLGAFNMVLADGLSYTSLISALETGDTYATSGPLFDALYAEGGRIYVRCRGAKEITLRTAGRRAASVRDDVSCGYAEFEVKSEDKYVRIVLTGEGGTHAYTRAYAVDEIL